MPQPENLRAIEELQEVNGRLVADIAHLRVYLQEHFKDRIDQSVSIVENVIRILDQPNVPPRRLRGEIDPNWVPAKEEDLPEFARLVDQVLMRLSARDELNQIRTEIISLYNAKSSMYRDESTGMESCYKRAYAGFHANMMRKFDRIEAVGIRFGLDRADAAVAAEAVADRSAEPETLYVTVRDLCVYALHTLRFLAAYMRYKKHEE